MNTMDPGVRVRVILASLLAASAVLLILLNTLQGRIEERRRTTDESVQNILLSIDRTIGRELRSHGIDNSRVRARNIVTPDRSFMRVERTVVIPDDFVTVSFNRDLNEALGVLGARAVATERTRGDIVSIHVIREGTVIQSLILHTVKTQ